MFLSFFIGLMVPSPVYSQSIAEHEGTLTITPSFVSDYMYRGVQLGGFSFQPTIEFTKGPLSLELFTNFPISDKIPGVSDPEIDFAASYAWDVVPNLFTIKPGFWVYTYPRADEDSYKFTCEPYLSFDYTLNDITFLLNLYYDILMKGGGYEFGFNYSIPIKSLNNEMKLFALIGRYDMSDFYDVPYIKIRNKGDYFQVGVAIPYEFSKKSKLDIAWYIAKGTNNFIQRGAGIRESNPHAVGRGVLSLSYSYSF